MAWVQECFETFEGRVRFGSVDQESGFRVDVSHPIHLTRATLAVSGLHYAFAPSDAKTLPAVLADQLAHVAVRKTELGRFPSTPLLLDSRLAEDNLGGFLGGDRRAKLLAMLPAADMEVLRLVLEEISVERTFSGLEDHLLEAAWWTRLHAVLGEFSLPPDLKQRLTHTILQTDFVAIAQADPNTGYFALQVGCTQSRRLAEEAVRLHLTDALWATARLFAEEKSTAANPEQVAQILLDCALSLAQCAPPAGRTMDEFAAITERLACAWPVIAEVARTGIQRLCEEVSFSESNRLWRLNLLLRCRT